MEYVLQTDNLRKKYGKFNALNGLSMNVPEGAIYGLVGKNGAGKTTLIRIICGLQEPTGGSYTLYGRKNDNNGITKSRRRMGAIVETPSIYLDMSARDNLKQQCLILGIPSFDRVDKILAQVGLENTKNKKARDFSLGMRQRLGIAVALVGDPDFLILDEPVNGLDPQGIVEIRELILTLNKTRRITIMISSHLLDELSKIATHYGFVNSGRIVKELAADELHTACRKCTRISVNDPTALLQILDDKNIVYKMVSDSQIDIFSSINISHLAIALSEKNCEILSVENRDENLETYYLSLIGGDKNE